MESMLIVLSIPIFLLFMGGELLIARARGRRLYRFADSICNLGNGIGEQILQAFCIPITVGVYAWVFAHARVTTISSKSMVAWVGLFFAVDFLYYAYHRASHRVNFLWADHVVHHSSEEYNFSVALRQSWFGQQLTEWVFYIPLALAGFPPSMFLVTITLNTLYQFFIHTRLVGRLGPLEWFMNTPSHHRVHHGINPQYIDKNYAGVFIIWDRLLGTWEPEGVEPVYGLVKPLGSFSPLWANVHRWVEIASLSRQSRRLRDKLWAWLAPPEWRPAELGGVFVPPEPDRDGPSLIAPRNGARDRNVALAFALTLGATSWFIYAAGANPYAPLVLATAASVLAAIISFGWIYSPARAR